MMYHIYTVGGVYISGKKHEKITDAMKTLSRDLNALIDGRVNEVFAVKVGTCEQVIFCTDMVHDRDGVIIHKVYDPTMSNYHEAIYIAGYTRASVTESLLDDLLNNEIILDRIEVYSLKTGRLIRAREKVGTIDGCGTRDVPVEEL